VLLFLDFLAHGDQVSPTKSESRKDMHTSMPVARGNLRCYFFYFSVKSTHIRLATVIRFDLWFIMEITEKGRKLIYLLEV
jgi:hypothetical protein